MTSTPIPKEVLQFRKAIPSLRLVFWGGLVTILGFRISVHSGGEVRSVQLLPDFIGLALVLPGMLRLTWLKVSSLYETLMSTVLGVCCAWALGSLFFTFRPGLAGRLGPIAPLIPLLTAFSAFLFAVSMLHLSKSAGAQQSEGAWKKVSASIMGLMVVPYGLAWIGLNLLRASGASSGVLLVVPVLVAISSFAGWLVVWWAYTVMTKEARSLPASTSLAAGSNPE
jgi:hypothetical protein